VVEATRVELVSETASTRASPGAFPGLKFPPYNAQEQALQFGSFINPTGFKALPGWFPDL